MSRKISQETFDDVVKENKEDFDMDDKAALEDAINQFNKQGVNLTGIDLSGGVGRQDILDAIKRLEESTKEGVAEASVLAAINSVAELCAKEHEYSSRNRMFLITYGGVNALHLLFDPKSTEAVLVATMNFLEDLSRNNIEIRDFFEPGGSERLNNVLKRFTVEPAGHGRFQTDEEKSRVTSPNHTIVQSALVLARAVSKSEQNKNMLMISGVGVTISSIIITRAAEYVEWAQVLTDCCLLMRGLCVHDDIRKDMSCAYENGRFFLKQNGMVAALMAMSAYFKAYPALASAALSAARNMIATEEAVQVMSQHGAIELIRDILSYPDAPVGLVRSAVGLMRNVCADDVRKDRLVGDGSLDLLINVMSQEQYAKDGGLMEHAVACLAQISLRSPSNAQRIVSAGAALDILARNMRRYSDRSGLQRQGCLTVRNIAARGPELRPVLLDAGFEDILRAAGRIMDVVDEAYGALRDLGCEVHYVKVGADGKVEPVYEQFGAATKLQFNPIYDEDVFINERVQEEARAPLPLPPVVDRAPVAPVNNDYQHDHQHGHEHGHDHGHDHVHGDDCCH